MANYLSEIELPNGNSYELKDKNVNVFFGTCPTAAATGAKVVTLTNGDSFELKAGAIVGVKFTYTNTASNVTINVNNTGAKSIWYNNAVYTSNASGITGYANRISYFMYDGTYWCLIHNGINNSNTTYAVCSTSANGLAPKITNTSGYLKGDGTWTVPPNDNTTYANATTAAAGLLRQLNGSTSNYLRGDGTWATPPDNNTTYAVATTAANGLMSSTDKDKINKIDWIIYDSVTDLGLTSGSCSIQQAYGAMADKTILICNAGDFNSSSVPSAYGIIKIIKYGGARWYIAFHAKDSTVADYRMYPLSGNNNPSGIWSTDNTINGILGLNSTLSSLTNYDSKCWCVGDNGYLYLNITLSSYTNGTQIAQMTKLRPAATIDVNIIPNAGSIGPYLRLQTDGQIMLYNFTASSHKGVRGLFSFPCTTNHPSPTL